MNLNHLRYFTVIVRRGSFQRASEDLNVTQPALSNCVRKLEYVLNVPLLERKPQGVVPTPYGEALNRFSLSALNSVERALLEIENLKRGSRGHLRIGAPAGIIEQILPLIIGEINDQKPDYSFDVSFGYLNQLIEGLVDDRHDYVLSTYWPAVSIPENLVLDHIADLSLSIYARANHPLVKARSVSLDDLLEAQWITPDSRGMADFFRRLTGDNLHGYLKRPIISRDTNFIHAMMQRMDLVSLIPDYVVRPLVEKGVFKKITYDRTNWELSAGLIYKRDRTQTPAIQLFKKKAIEITRDLLS